MEETKIGKYKRWFKDAIRYWDKWSKEAQEDFDFVRGDQWSKEDKKAFEDAGRPAIVINRIKPLMNVLSGYQRLNRYDVDFLPRTNDDTQICQVRKGITKYILDRCDYNSEESNAFMDCAISGLGWLEVSFDELTEEAKVMRCDPFGIYVDPESRRNDFEDAKYICRAKWVDKEELKEIYPEHAETIEAQITSYDELESEVAIDRHIWYLKEQQKIRLIECWYKQRRQKTKFVLTNGQKIESEEIPPDQLMMLYSQGLIMQTENETQIEVKVASFFDDVLLEDIASPYKHQAFPFVALTCFYYGIGGEEIPTGIVRDLKDPQRELNRRRIQFLHILNTTGNGGGFIEEDAMNERQFAEFSKNGSIPGHFQRVRSMALAQGKIMERQIGQIPAGVLQAEAESTADLQAISGINEALMGTDIPNGASGRAIELKQKSAITHITPLFDELRRAKKKIAYLLWGETGKAGIIPQFYTADKVYRIEGINGQQFIRVNQQVIQQDPTAGIIIRTLNDLSQGEFDIVVSDVQASTTQRQSQMWGLIEAIGQLGVPGDLIFDIIIDLSDLPNKEDIKQRWQQRQQQQMQASQQQIQAQLELERIKNENLNQSISFKDAPLPIQLAMCAKAGLIDPAIAQHAIDIMAEQMFPGYAQQQQQQQMMMMNQNQAPPPPPPTQQQQPPEQRSGLTKAAMQSLMSNSIPAI